MAEDRAPTDRRRLPPGMTPRLLSRSEAAAYCGVSLSLFEECVGVPPMNCWGNRKLWDRRALDGWLDKLSGISSLCAADEPGGEGGSGVDWEKVLR